MEQGCVNAARPLEPGSGRSPSSLGLACLLELHNQLPCWHSEVAVGAVGVPESSCWDCTAALQLEGVAVEAVVVAASLAPAHRRPYIHAPRISCRAQEAMNPGMRTGNAGSRRACLPQGLSAHSNCIQGVCTLSVRSLGSVVRQPSRRLLGRSQCNHWC